MKRFFVFILINVALVVSYAQERHPFINSVCDYFTTDIHDNLYLWADASLNKYDNTGKFLYQHSNPSLGDISNVDASFPSKTMVFYQSAGIIQLLDDKLAPLGNSINLFEHNLNTITLAAMIGTHKIALYDDSNHNLYIIDLYANILSTTHCSFDEDFSPCQMQSFYEETIMMLDTSQGIYTFDILGTFKSKISLPETRAFTKIGNEIIFLKESEINYYNQKHLDLKKSGIINPNLKNFRLGTDGYYLQENDGKIYKLNVKRE